jgi:hypothetical protein
VTPDRFVTDSSLEFLARRLRFLGYDVLTLRGARLEEVFERAAREGRIVLTLSPRHPRRFGAVPVMHVAREWPEEAVRTIASSYTAASAPFSRCPECNTALQGRTSFEAVGEVPGRVLRRSQWLHYCPTCGKWYWDGTHTANLRAWLERVLERPLEPPATAPPPAGPLP